MPTTPEQPSCYLLEFSVQPGGSRMAVVHARPDLAGLRAAFEADRYADVASYLIMSYGAVLHLWVVRHGEVVHGVDLHPFLRTGEPRCDAALARVLRRDEADDELLELVFEAYGWTPVAALPLLTRAFAWQDRAAAGDRTAADALDELLGDLDEDNAPATVDGMTTGALTLDWAAVADALPDLEEPLLTHAGTVVPRWTRECPNHPDSALSAGRRLHAGLNDLEHGDDEWPAG